MHAARRVALGLGLADMAFLYFAGLFASFTLDLETQLIIVGSAVVAVGLLAALLGVLHLDRPRGSALLAGGITLAAAGHAITTLMALSGPGNFKAGYLLIEAGLCVAAYYTLAAHFEGAERSPARYEAARVGLAACAAGMGWFLFLNLSSFFLFLPGSLLGLLGFVLATRHLGEAAPRPEARSYRAPVLPRAPTSEPK